MFCLYEDDAGTKVFSGAIKTANGTYPAAWLRVKDSRESINVYEFVDKSEDVRDDFHSVGALSDAAPDDDGVVVRTAAAVDLNLGDSKTKVLNQIAAKRKSVARRGVIHDSKNFDTDPNTVESINLIASAFHGDSIDWLTMDTPKVASAIYACDETEFKALRTAVAKHWNLCTTNAQAHITAVKALDNFAAVRDYDLTTDWPDNPDMSPA